MQWLREGEMHTGMTNRNGAELIATRHEIILEMMTATGNAKTGMTVIIIVIIAGMIETKETIVIEAGKATDTTIIALHIGRLRVAITNSHVTYTIAIIMCIMTVIVVSISPSQAGIISIAILCHHI
jgi:hypothetical protein